MPPPALPQLPFLTRDMLSFGAEAKFELELVAYAAVTNAIFIVGLTREGVIKHTFLHSGDGTDEGAIFQIPDIPIVLTVFTESASVERGEYWASIFLLVNGEKVMKLCSGYISKQSAINFPATQSESERDGGGVLQTISVDSPAAGSDWSEAMAGNQMQRLRSVHARLVTDANVADRSVHLEVEEHSSFRDLNFFSGVKQPASTTREYTFAPVFGLLAYEDDNDIIIPIPANMAINSARDVGTATVNLQVGDQWSEIRVNVETFIED